MMMAHFEEYEDELYGDLNFDSEGRLGETKQQLREMIEKVQKENHLLREKNTKLLQVTHLLESKNAILQRNISLLYVTAKSELNRHRAEIGQLKTVKKGSSNSLSSLAKSQCTERWRRYLSFRFFLSFGSLGLISYLSFLLLRSRAHRRQINQIEHLTTCINVCSRSPSFSYNEHVIYNITNEIVKIYDINTERLEDIRMALQHEMEMGLESENSPNHRSTLKMLPSYFNQSLLNAMHDVVYALDIGGTNLRVLKLQLNPNGLIKNLATNKHIIPESVRLGECEELFDFLSQCVAESTEVSDEHHNLGFTFSFPVLQTSIKAGHLLEWTKGFSTKNVVGQDVAVLLDRAFEKYHIPLCHTALINDTVGTLLTGAFESQDSNCVIGLILGTGSNACYLEDIDNVKKWLGSRDFPQMIINIEWGAFDSPNYHCLSPTKFDLILDQQSLNPNKQHFEKMMSGMYLGEIVRLTLKHYHETHRIFLDEFPSSLENPYSFETQFMSQIEQDTSFELHGVGSVLKTLGVPMVCLGTRRLVKQTCAAVSRRSARLAAAGITAIIEHLGRSDTFSIVAIDGSLFELYPGYRMIMENAIRELGYPHIQTRIVKDGSGNGAGIAALLAQRIGQSP